MLSACAATGAAPLVDNRAHSDLITALTREYPSIASAIGLESIDSQAWKEKVLAVNILAETVPEIQVRDIESVLYLRDEMVAELAAFRAEIAKLAASVKSNAWDQTFEKEIQEKIASDVRPAITSLEQRLARPTRRMLKHLVSDWSSIVSGAAIPLTALVVKNGSLPWALLAGASAAMGLAAIKTKVEEWELKQQSSMTFIFEARQRFHRKRK